MAVSLLIRVIVTCLGNATCSRAAEIATVSAASGGSTTYGNILRGVEETVRRWTAGDDSTDIEAGLNAGPPEESDGWTLTDFTDAFELRKLQWRLSRAPGGSTTEDVDVCTFHFIKATGGVPGTYSDSTDLAAVESALSVFWNNTKTVYPTFIHSDQYRWYKDGPAFYHLNDDGTAYVPNGGNAAIRVTEVDVAGTGGTGDSLPPQSAISITEKTSKRSSWGRFYLPAPLADNTTGGGYIDSTILDGLHGAAVTFYNACRTAHMVPVVFSIAKPERPKRPSGTLAAQAAIAYEVLALQADNLFDVIRSRRWRAPTYKPVITLT